MVRMRSERMPNRSRFGISCLLTVAVCTVIAVGPLQAQIPTNGLVAYYPFSGNTSDSSGNGNNGVNNGCVYAADQFGDVNRALSFNGTSNYVQLPFSSTSLSSSFSFTAWVDWLNVSSDPFVAGIFSNDVDTSRGILIGITPSTQQLYTQVYTTVGSYAYYDGPQIIPNSWEFISVTYSGDSLKIYKNGSLIAKKNLLGTIGGGLNLQIGHNTYTSRYFGGYLDEVRIYNRALNDAEIQTLYQQGTLVAHYTFSGNTADSSGNGNNGINNGAVLAADRFGKANKAYDFNGTNAYVNCGNAGSLNMNNALTLSAWIKPRSVSDGRVISKWGLSSGYEMDLYNQNVEFGFNQSSFVSANISYLLNTWIHVVGSYDGTTVKLYVNGALKSTYGPYSTTIVNSTYNLLIGEMANMATSYFNGLIDDVRIYNRALRAGEIDTLYKEGGWADDKPVVFEPYTISGVYLNRQIAADTAANGWVHNRVYVLRKDGFYLWDSVFAVPAGQSVRLRAEYGSAGHSDPIVYLYSPTLGRPPAFMFDTKGDVNLKHIVASGCFEPYAASLDSLQGGLLRVNLAAAGANLYIDSCILKTTNGNHIRTEGRPGVIKATNTIFADMGFLGTSNLGGGKAIDLRGQQVDTCWVQNCTFVNFHDRIIRHYLSSGPISNLIFDHNTIVNGMSYHGMLSLGWVDSTGLGTLQITNNLLLDAFSLGADTDATRQAEFTDSGEKDPKNNLGRMTWVIARPNTGANWNISRNYYAVSDSGSSILNTYPYYKNEGSPLTWGINARLAMLGKDTVNAFKKIGVLMTSIPKLMTVLDRWYYTPESQGGAGKTKNTGNFTRLSPGYWKSDYDRRSAEYYIDTLNCSYYTSEIPVSTDGKAVGDTRWIFLGVSGSFIPKPINLAVSASAPNINLTWASGGGSPVRYRIYRGLDSTTMVLVDSSTSTTYSTSTGFTFGTQYFFRISAIDASGAESSRSAAAVLFKDSQGTWSGTFYGSTDARIITAPQISNRVTVEAWIYLFSMNQDTAVIFKRVTTNANLSTPVYALELRRPGPGVPPYIEFRISDGTDGGVISASSKALGTSVPLFTWTHVAGVYDGSAVRVYINGVQQGATAASRAIPTQGEIRFGASVYRKNVFNGFIDEVRLWDTTRTEGNLQSGMNTISNPATVPHIIGCWKFEDANTPDITPPILGEASDHGATGTYRGGHVAEISHFDSPGNPIVSVSPGSFALDTVVEVGDNVNTGTLNFTNIGTGKLVLCEGPIYVVASGATLPLPNGKSFVVQSAGTIRDTIEFLSNAPTSPTRIPVSGGTVLPLQHYDGNNISTPLSRNGRFANNTVSHEAGFEWPKGSGHHAIYQAGLWLAATVSSEVRTAVASYQSEFQPGDAQSGMPANPSSTLYRVYKINRGDNSATNPDYAGWPASLGAPVNSDGTPKLLGDQQLFSVYNDLNSASHTTFATNPLGAEVQQVTYGFNTSGTFSNTAYLQYKIVNRSASTWNNAYAAFWVDPDMGYWLDDFIGCDSVNNFGYVYNGSPTDTAYGSNPPAIGFVYMKGPLPGKLMTSFVYFAANSDVSDPASATEAYNLLKGVKPDGSAIINPATGASTRYMLSGTPENGTGWRDSSPGDRRLIVSSGPFNLAPGQSTDVVIAAVVARGSDYLNSVTKLRQAVAEVQAFGTSSTPPSSPALLMASGSNASVTLKWAKNSEPDVARYRIYGGTVSNPTAPIDSTSASTDTMKTVTGLSNGILYYFRVTAVDISGNESGYSNQLSATPQVSALLGEYGVDGKTVLLMHMNETIGATVGDASGRGNIGAASSGAVITTQGRFGNARTYDGTMNAYVQVPTSTSLTFGAGSFTAETWVKTTSMLSTQRLIFRNTGVTNRQWSLDLGFSAPTGVLSFDGLGNNCGGSTPLNDGRWHHVAVVKNGPTVSLYADGKYEAGTTVALSDTNVGSLYIGGVNYNPTATLDEVRISSSARNPGEFNLQLPPVSLTANPNGSSIRLSWQNGGGAVPLMRYKIYGGTDSTSLTLIDSTSQLSFQSSGLIAGWRYFYRVSAVDSSGFEGAKSYAASATAGTGPSVPAIYSLSPSSGPVGTVVTISGSDFNSTASNNIVFFGAVKAVVTGGGSSSLSVTVPYGATFAPISVTDMMKGLTAYSSAPFITTFAGNHIIDTTSFVRIASYATGVGPEHCAVADLDGDGKPDIIVTDTINAVSVLRNTSTSGTISFAAKADFAGASGANGVAIADLDGDGKPDVVVANVASGTVSVFGNTSTSGNISFASRTDQTVGGSPIEAAIGDLDGDGRPDIAVANWTSNSVTVLRNTSSIGTISFATGVDYDLSGGGSYGVAMADLDGDGKPDLIVGSATKASVFRNTSSNGNISFASRTDITMNGSVNLVVGDVDGDNKIDIAASQGTTMSVYRNQSSIGNISFAAGVDFTTGITGNSFDISMGDLDGDGKPEIAVANHESRTISVFKNTSTSGNASFASRVDFALDGPAWGMAFCDLDADGLPDLVAASTGDNLVLVFRNGSGTTDVTAPNITFNQNTVSSVIVNSNGNVNGSTPMISATAYDETNGSGVKKMTVQYRQTGATNWQSNENQSGSISIQLPQNIFAFNNHPIGVDYRIGAEDNAGNANWTAVYSVDISVASGSTLTNPTPLPSASSYASSERVKAYRVISVPYDLDDKRPSVMMSNWPSHDFNGVSYARWRMVRYVNQNPEDYESFRDQNAIQPGAAFFFITTEQSVPLAVGSGKVVKADYMNDTGIPLTAGWNLVGNPLLVDIPFSSLQFVGGTIDDHAYYSGSSSSTSGWEKSGTNADVLSPWQGLAIHVTTSGTLLLRTIGAQPKIIDRGVSPRAVDVAAKLKKGTSNWMITVDASRPDIGMQCIGNSLGMIEGASEQRDENDSYMPPFVGDKNVALYFSNPDGSMMRDIRPLNDSGSVWPMHVVTGDASARVKLQFGGAAKLPNPDFEAYLIDLDQKMAFNLKEVSTVEINSGDGVRSLNVVVGKHAYVEQNNSGVELNPSVMRLYANYPNPFNPETVIRFTVPNAAPAYQVTLKVYNIVGQEVATLANDLRTTGYYEVRWDARGRSSGVYFYRLTMSDGAKMMSAVRKMVLLK
jgi:hypothetical protein